MATSDQDYYENPEKWGESKFTTLESIVDNIIILADDDSYLKKIKRFRASLIGKLALKEFKVDIQQNSKAISFALGTNKTFPYPRYMHDWFRISFVADCGKLQVIDINNDSPLVEEHLQDNDYKLLYDEYGNILDAKDKNSKKGNCIDFLTCENGKLYKEQELGRYWVKDISNASYFEFSDSLIDKEIVIEFESSSLESLKDCDIKVHLRMEETLSYFIKWKILENKRNTPINDVVYNRDMYKLEKKKTRRFLAKKITIEQILSSVSLRYNN